MHTRIITLAVLLVTCSGHLLQSTPPLTTEWRYGSIADPTSSLDVTFALRRRHVDRQHAAFDAVTDPTSPTYGKYWTADQVAELTTANPDDVARIIRWASPARCHHQYSNGVRCSMTVNQAATLLNTEFRVVQHRRTQQTALRAGDVHVPEHLLDCLESVYGVHGLPLPRRVRVPTPPTSLPITPAVIIQRYNVSGVAPSGSVAHRQAVVEFDQSSNQPDLTQFFQQYVKNAPPGSDKVYKYVGPHTERDDVEAELDIQYIMGVAPGIKTEMWESMSHDFCTAWKNYTEMVHASTDPPLVHSISFGVQDSLSFLGCTPSQVAELDSDFQRMALRGITVLVASGDSGSGEMTDQCPVFMPGITWTGGVISTLAGSSPGKCCAQCVTEEPKGCLRWVFSFKTSACTTHNNASTMGQDSSVEAGGMGHGKLWPSWPSTSAYVTGVGSTRFINNVVGPEMGTDMFGSGGGFSWDNSVPDFQASAAAAYFKIAKNLPPNNLFARNGRGTPDVSALGEAFQVVVNGKVMPVSGTSAATPAFAALVGLINEARAAKGMPSMGYMNKFLYSNPHTLTDVVVGTNRINRSGKPFKYGYDCVPGWDPVSGLGTPNFPALLKAALSYGARDN